MQWRSLPLFVPQVSIPTPALSITGLLGLVSSSRISLYKYKCFFFSLFPIREHSIHTVLYFACVPNHIFWKPFHISTQRASSFFVFYSYIVFLVTCIHLVTWSLYHGHLGCFQSVSHYGHTPMHHFAHMQPYFHRYVIPVFLLDWLSKMLVANFI